MKNLDALTIEDLRLILAIINEGSLTAGAVNMRMSQSNASYSLKKIQTAFQTDLFVRKGRKLVPSEFGWHVYQHVTTLLTDFQTVVHPPVFDPDSKFTLNFGATEYDTIAVFPHIQRLLKIHAPNAKLRIIALDTSETSTQLQTLDFIFVPANIQSDDVQTLELFQDTATVFYDKTMCDAPNTLAKYAAAPHGIASFDGSTTTFTDRILANKGLSRDVVVSVFGFSALARLIRGTDIITTLPKRLEKTLFADFSQCAVPFKDEPMMLYLCWETAKEERGKIIWFADMMKNNPIDP